MVDLLILVLFLAIGGSTGWLSANLLPNDLIAQFLLSEGLWEQVSTIGDLQLVFGGFGALVGALIGLLFQWLRRQLTKRIRTMPTDLLLSRSVGLILGLLVANLLLAPILLLPLPREIILIKPFAAIASNIFFGIIGYNLADIHGRTLLRLFNPNSTEALLLAEGILTPATAKILDTSVIIDGRIDQLLKSEIIEGKVIIAQTVIDELQQLADSKNQEKRGKGRRGLDLLTNLRKDYDRKLVINSTKYDGKGADDKLLKLTEDTGGTLITSDYNLSQVAKVQGIKVLNLSELVIALRPNIQPGEKLNLKIVREGKEGSQGVGYLDDGTMVVVEGAKKVIGQRLDVVVTGALQTPTGRMIFGQMQKKSTSTQIS